jgi:hypothetical protein
MKSKLLGIHKTQKHSVYVFSKGDDFIQKIRKILSSLGFTDELTAFIDCRNGKEVDLNPVKTTDIREVCEGGDTTSHFIFGNKKIFMIIHYERDRQEEICNKILESFSLGKPKGRH